MNVLRMGGDEITHVYFVTIDGVKNYLTKEDYDRIIVFDEDQIKEYYSGEDSEEVESLKDDMTKLMTGEISLEQMKLRIAISTGLIKDKIFELN